MMSSVTRVKFIKTNVVFRYHSKDVSIQVRITKSKVSHVQILVPKWEKRKSGKISSGLQNGTIRGLQIGTDFMDHKWGQEELQIGATSGISNRGKNISNRRK